MLRRELEELKTSDWCGFSIQSEAGGQLGVVRAAVSQVWLPGAPSGGALIAWAVHGENSPCGSVGTTCFGRCVAGDTRHLHDSMLAGQQQHVSVSGLTWDTSVMEPKNGLWAFG